jgi:hypothetical protein
VTDAQRPRLLELAARLTDEALGGADHQDGPACDSGSRRQMPPGGTIEPPWDEALAGKVLRETLDRLARACPPDWRIGSEDAGRWRGAEESVGRAFREKRMPDVVQACQGYERAVLRAFDAWRQCQTPVDPPLAAATATCRACGGHWWWFSIQGIRVCGICHPPAHPSLLARWEGEEPPPMPEPVSIPLTARPSLALHALDYACMPCGIRWSEVQVTHTFLGERCPRCGAGVDHVYNLVAPARLCRAHDLNPEGREDDDCKQWRQAANSMHAVWQGSPARHDMSGG